MVLGDPRSKVVGGNVFVPSISRDAVLHAEAVSGSCPRKLALNLLQVLFTHSELATDNCTKEAREDIVLLDQQKNY